MFLLLLTAPNFSAGGKRLLLFDLNGSTSDGQHEAWNRLTGEWVAPFSAEFTLQTLQQCAKFGQRCASALHTTTVQESTMLSDTHGTVFTKAKPCPIVQQRAY